MSDPSTVALVELVQQGAPFALPVVETLVDRGADVMHRLPTDPESHRCGVPILSFFMQHGYQEAALICLRSPQPLDFTIPDGNGQTPIHSLVGTSRRTVGEAFNRVLLDAVVDRLERHPQDTVDWDSLDVLSLAAKNLLLHVVWPLVKHLPYFEDNVDLIPLKGEVWMWDWNALRPEEQERLDTTRVEYFHQGDQQTGKLWKALTAVPLPDAEEVERCVAAGADVLYRAAYWSRRPILTFALYWDPPGTVERLLRSPTRLDLTLTDKNGWTPLHAIPFRKDDPGDVHRLLSLLIQRLDRHRDDKVDWGQPCSEGHSPISWAAFWGHLAVWVRLVFHEYPVQYYTAGLWRGGMDRVLGPIRGLLGGHPIRITHPVKMKDWDQIPLEDQKRFDLTCGVDRTETF